MSNEDRFYIHVKSMIGYKFMVVDVEERVWCKVLNDLNIRWKGCGWFHKMREKYIIQIIRIPKKDKERLTEVYMKVKDTLDLMGYNDYDDMMEEVFSKFDKG